jgi:hypothetical protein
MASGFVTPQQCDVRRGPADPSEDRLVSDGSMNRRLVGSPDSDGIGRARTAISEVTSTGERMRKFDAWVVDRFEVIHV